MRFSERYGYKPVREIIQKESMDDHLKNGLWSIFDTYIWKKVTHEYWQYKHTNSSNIYTLIYNYYFNFFKKPTDSIPLLTADTLKQIREYFFSTNWHEIYSFLEETLQNYPPSLIKQKIDFIHSINNILERENSAYRLIGNEITPITSEQEIQSIEETLKSTNSYSGVQQHLNQALKLMSDRQNPDYRNSIKESISSVESICKIVTKNDKASLGQALKLIEDKYGLHEALKKSLSQLYGYTSDGDGIRHAMLEESNLTYIDAKFMLVACTNFINYLIDKTKDQN
ncbi:MAG: AbiJ-NTD4 domain-containing protein [Acinetobacter gandensis]|uniref:AbiJ-NTD4 domain-containing protein n=1 Tax=Acinetobacter gandensis TaxID=1443941 RepID=UPI003D0834DE